MSNTVSELDCPSSDKELRVSLYSDVIKICEETFKQLGLETSLSAMMIIAELVYQKLSIYRLDLEAFANHAERPSIDIEDVRLLVRRNPSLKAHLFSLYPDRTATKPNITSKKRKIEKNNNRGRSSPIL